MEFATGESLEDVIRRHPQGLPAEERSNGCKALPRALDICTITASCTAI